jgi:ATP-dependent Clp protease ATP-binding subunit ClpC
MLKMFKEFTEGAQVAVRQAQTEARARSDERVGGEHLLLGLLQDGTGVAADLLGDAEVTPERGRQAVDELYGPPPAAPPGEAVTAPQRMPFGDAAKAALMASVPAAGDGPIGTEHVLLGLLDDGDGRAVEVLRHLGVDVAALAERTRAAEPGPGSP